MLRCKSQTQTASPTAKPAPAIIARTGGILWCPLAPTFPSKPAHQTAQERTPMFYGTCPQLEGLILLGHNRAREKRSENMSMPHPDGSKYSKGGKMPARMICCMGVGRRQFHPSQTPLPINAAMILPRFEEPLRSRLPPIVDSKPRHAGPM